jgi:hypothetical protein
MFEYVFGQVEGGLIKRRDKRFLATLSDMEYRQITVWVRDIRKHEFIRYSQFLDSFKIDVPGPRRKNRMVNILSRLPLWKKPVPSSELSLRRKMRNPRIRNKS